MRPIDADVVIKHIEEYWEMVKRGKPSRGMTTVMQNIKTIVNSLPTIDAVPTEFVMGNCNLDFICYELTDDGEWCSEHCQYSEPQPECIHRYIDRIWRKEHDQTN